MEICTIFCQVTGLDTLNLEGVLVDNRVLVKNKQFYFWGDEHFPYSPLPEEAYVDYQEA